MGCPKQTGSLQGHRRDGGALAGDDSRIAHRPNLEQNKQGGLLLVLAGHSPERIAIIAAARERQNPSALLISVVVTIASAVAGPMCYNLTQGSGLDALNAAASKG